MGLLDRAFGVDKNSMLFNRLAFHWRAVASHYKNCVAKGFVADGQIALMNTLYAKSESLADQIVESKKGFGVVSIDSELIKKEIMTLSELHSQISPPTEKHHWLPEVVIATTEILSGNKKRYQDRQYWFSDR
jgi:hypothetical protein